MVKDYVKQSAIYILLGGLYLGDFKMEHGSKHLEDIGNYDKKVQKHTIA